MEQLQLKDDLSIKDALFKYSGWNSNDCVVKQLIEWFEFDCEQADNTEKSSIIHNFMNEQNDIDFGHVMWFVTDQRGFSCILDNMVKDIKQNIHLNRKVDSVQYGYDNDEVVVSTVDTVTGQEFIYKGTKVICTVSIGVL